MLSEQVVEGSGYEMQGRGNWEGSWLLNFGEWASGEQSSGGFIYTPEIRGRKLIPGIGLSGQSGHARGSKQASVPNYN